MILNSQLLLPNNGMGTSKSSELFLMLLYIYDSVFIS